LIKHFALQRAGELMRHRLTEYRGDIIEVCTLESWHMVNPVNADRKPGRRRTFSTGTEFLSLLDCVCLRHRLRPVKVPMPTRWSSNVALLLLYTCYVYLYVVPSRN